MALEDRRSIAEIVKDIVGNVQQIVRTEMRLAVAEVREEISKAGKAGAFMAAGALFGIIGVQFLLLAVVYVLGRVMPLYAAAGAVAAGAAVVGGILIAVGKAQLKHLTLPQKTLTSLQENIQWAKSWTS